MSCATDIQYQLDLNDGANIENLETLVLVPFSVSATANKLFKFEIIATEAAIFTISFDIAPIGSIVSFYTYSESLGILLPLGFANLPDRVTEFQKDFSPDVYYMCITSNITNSGTIYGEFSAFTVVKRFYPTTNTGTDSTADLYLPPRPPIDCQYTYQCDMVGGDIPSGMTFNNGLLSGVLPNLDCEEYTEDYSPSQNWYYKFGNAKWYPWGAEWRYTVRCYFVDFSEIYIEDEFCLRVYNNWSWDKDLFDTIPKDKEVEIIEQTTPELIEEVLPEISGGLCDCDAVTTSEQQTTLEFLQWYQTVLNVETDSPEIEAFKANFITSDYYAQLLAQANLPEDLTPEEQTAQVVSATIAAIEASLTEDGKTSATDYDKVMIDLKTEANKALPMSGDCRTLVECYADLYVRSLE